MENDRQILAANLAMFRKKRRLTQAELAERINYSDKVISKWERGESMPDVLVLKQLAGLYGITVDRFLTEKEQPAQAAPATKTTEEATEDTVQETKPALRGSILLHNVRITAALSLLLVCFLATLAFFIVWAVTSPHVYYWRAFLYAVPGNLVAWLVLNSIWGDRQKNLLIISLLIWCTLGTIFFGLWTHKLWMIFILGIPAQAATVFAFRFRQPSEKP